MHAPTLKATAGDAAKLAALRWRQVTERSGDNGRDRDAFVESFATWTIDHLASHRPFVAESDGELVGMAWLLVGERVPGRDCRRRQFGDVQSVYVVPEVRNGGVGAAQLTELLAEAAAIELEHVTVHSSDRAVPLYQRVGFDYGRAWLRWARD